MGQSFAESWSPEALDEDLLCRELGFWCREPGFWLLAKLLSLGDGPVSGRDTRRRGYSPSVNNLPSVFVFALGEEAIRRVAGGKHSASFLTLGVFGFSRGVGFIWILSLRPCI
jgi:hypothetical protein